MEKIALHYMRSHRVRLGLVVLFLLGAACGNPPPATPINGELDLREWNFASSGELSLHGDWRFYWQRLLTHGDFDVPPGSAPPTADGRVALPGTWNGMQVSKDETLTGDGFATFELLLRLPPESKAARVPLAVHLTFMLTAYELTANGTPVCKNGTVGRDPAQSRPHYVPCTGLLPGADENGNLRLLLRVSNFHHRRGGPRGHITLGSRSQMEADELRRLVRDAFLFAAMFVVGGYYLLLFGQRRHQFEYLFFAGLCFVLALRNSVLEEMLFIRLFPDVPWELFIRIIFVTAYLVPPLMFAFYRAVFPEEFSRTALLVYFIAGLLFVSSLLLPLKSASWGILLISPWILISVLHICIQLLRGIRTGRPGTALQLLGLVLLLGTMINDMLHDLQVILTGYYTSLGMFVFITFQGFVLTLRYSKSFSTIEKMYRDLKDHQQAELELLELNQSKDRFLSIISHDLRGPFSGLHGSLRYLSEHGGELEQDKLLEAISHIERESTNIYRLMENLLEWARSRMGQMEFQPEPIRIRELLEENLELLRSSLAEKEINAELRVPLESMARGDRRMLATIIRNILSNAIKFTPRGGEIVIHLDDQSEANSSLVPLVFTDTGIGIDAETRAGIFRLDAVRSRAGTEGEPGSGLGLLLCRELIERNGGTLDVESNPGIGSQFSLRLPRA